jgi:hypothetical protein
MFLLFAFSIVNSNFDKIEVVENQTAVMKLNGIEEEIQAIFKQTKIVTFLATDQLILNEILEKFLVMFKVDEKSYILYNNLNEFGWQDICENHHMSLNELRAFHPPTNISVSREEYMDLHTDNIPVDKSILYEQFGYIVLTGSAELEKRIQCLSFKATGSLFFIVADGIGRTDLLATLRKSWKKLEFLKIFIFNGTIIHLLDPFLIDENDGFYGTLIQYSAHRKITAVSRNMNLFPINVEIFNSVFTIDKNDGKAGKAENLTLNSFYGPDVTVAKVIMRRMNFTGRLIKNSIMVVF